MRRREFIVGLGSAVALPVVTRAQQSERTLRVGVALGFDDGDPVGKYQFSRFTQGLAESGWNEGRNLRMDVRWAGSGVDRTSRVAKELVGLRPDAIFAANTPLASALQSETRTIPIVFVIVGDPITAGLVASLPHPGGNLTGFITTEPRMAGKWLELLTEIAPGIDRAAAMFNPDTAPDGGTSYLRAFEAAARSIKLAPVAALVRSDAEIENVMASLGREPGVGLVVMPDVFTVVHRAAIISLAAQSKVAAVYWHSIFCRDGGLLSYGPDYAELFHQASFYVDRVLRGAKPADLPVQLPTKFEMTLNGKTAKTLGLAVPQSILLRADEVIE